MTRRTRRELKEALAGLERDAVDDDTDPLGRVVVSWEDTGADTADDPIVVDFTGVDT